MYMLWLAELLLSCCCFTTNPACMFWICRLHSLLVNHQLLLDLVLHSALCSTQRSSHFLHDVGLCWPGMLNDSHLGFSVSASSSQSHVLLLSVAMAYLRSMYAQQSSGVETPQNAVSSSISSMPITVWCFLQRRKRV